MIPAVAAAEAPRRAKLVCVDPARVSEIWPHVAHLIRRAMERGGLSEFADVERSVAAGRALLWLVWDGAQVLAAGVTALDLINGVKFCTIVACGGRGLERFGGLIDGVERYARAEGCARMRICGRKGWARVLPDYSIKRVILEKELN